MNDIINFLQDVNKLKNIKRTGWVVKNVKNPESVADHSFRVALMALLLCPEHLDKNKMIKMALINELPEAVTGDIVTKHDDKKEFTKSKYEKEKKVIRKMVKDLDNKNEIIDLFDESESLVTEESKFLKQLDKLEMAFQALEYEKSGDKEKFNEFWETTRNTLEDQKLIEIFTELEKKR